MLIPDVALGRVFLNILAQSLDGVPHCREGRLEFLISKILRELLHGPGFDYWPVPARERNSVIDDALVARWSQRDCVFEELYIRHNQGAQALQIIGECFCNDDYARTIRGVDLVALEGVGGQETILVQRAVVAEGLKQDIVVLVELDLDYDQPSSAINTQEVN